jgi:hypothetical protein
MATHSIHGLGTRLVSLVVATSGFHSFASSAKVTILIHQATPATQHLDSSNIFRQKNASRGPFDPCSLVSKLCLFDPTSASCLNAF